MCLLYRIPSWLIGLLNCPYPDGRVVLAVESGGATFVGVERMVYPDDFERPIRVAAVFLNKRGNVARVDGVPVWTISGPEVATLDPAADGMSVRLVLTGAVGVAQISVRADANLDVGEVRELIKTDDLEVVPGEAVSVGMTFTPE